MIYEQFSKHLRIMSSLYITLPAYDITTAFTAVEDKYRDQCLEADIEWLYNPRFHLTGVSRVYTRDRALEWAYTFKVTEG